MKKHLLVLTILSIGILTGCKKNVEDVTTNEEDLFVTKEASKSISGQFVPNELLVKFKAGTGEKSRIQTLSSINGVVEEHLLTSAMKAAGDNQGIYLVNTPVDVNSAMARMKGESNIEYAEPNWIYNHQAVSNDTYYTNGSLWGMYGDATSPANQYGSQAGEAWAAGKTGSSTVYIGVIDEGAMYYHEDLGNFGNPGEIGKTAGVDDDGNGYVDDIYGWDFVNNDNTTFDGVDDDHGTHVSGTIGGKGGNGIGVAGVNWNVTLISAKFLGTNGGTLANAVKAVDYITDLKNRLGLNLPATNNSWGGGGFSQALQDAITRAGNANILFIAAAGNDGLNTETSTSYPSGYDNASIIAVASITSTGAISSFSNYAITKVDLGAPGSGIYSTLPARSRGKVVSSYGSYSGTSMATPHVTGGAALYAASNPTASAATIKAAILNSAVFTSSLNGKCVTNGRLNVSGF
jgi:subtilisin family serine protease